MSSLVKVERLAETEVGDEHPMARATFCMRDKDVLGFDVTVDDLERVQVSETCGHLAQGALRVEGAHDLLVLIRPLDDVR